MLHLMLFLHLTQHELVHCKLCLLLHNFALLLSSCSNTLFAWLLHPIRTS